MASKDETKKMNDSELLEGTIGAVRDERRRRAHEARLEEYAEGKIDAESVAEAARLDGTDEDLDEELRAYAPLSAEARGRITERVLEQRHPVSRAVPARGRAHRFRRVTVGAG